MPLRPLAPLGALLAALLAAPSAARPALPVEGASLQTPRTLPETPRPNVAAGRIERLFFEGDADVPGRAIDVWLPPGYPDAAPYAVALMFDGQMLFDAAITWNRQEWRADETAARLQGEGRTRPFVIVAVPNAGGDRHAEYFPQGPFDALPDEARSRLLRDARRGELPLFTRAPYSDAFLAWIEDRVLPGVAARFALSTAPDDRVAIGASMGGLIAMEALLERPQAFGGFGALSTHWPGVMPDAAGVRPEAPVPAAFLRHLRERLPAPGRHRLYFDHGTATLDAFYPPLQAAADRIAVERGWAFPGYRSLVFPGAEHSEAAWAARLDGVFTFLLPPRGD